VPDRPRTNLDENALSGEWFRGIMSLGEYGLPAVCPGCGKIYHTLSEILRRSEQGLHDSGMLQAVGEDNQPLVGFYSLCECGKRIKVFVRDRRDRSAEGLLWRETFGELLEAFRGVGIPTQEARQELLKALRGKDLAFLRQFRQAALIIPPERAEGPEAD
jgi:hypothetical protein